jgi:hypothetical protein
VHEVIVDDSPFVLLLLEVWVGEEEEEAAELSRRKIEARTGQSNLSSICAKV